MGTSGAGQGVAVRTVAKKAGCGSVVAFGVGRGVGGLAAIPFTVGVVRQGFGVVPLCVGRRAGRVGKHALRM